MARILLLEPNLIAAKQYAEFLTSFGHEIICCANAQAGVEAADKAKPDLLIIELQLVGHSGIEFLYEFRSYPEWQTVPTVILTSLPTSASAIPETKLKELGIKAYLYKPTITLEKLAKIVRSVTETKVKT